MSAASLIIRGMGMLRSRSGKEIATLEDWRDLGGPASSKHWVDGRSAKCLAEWWLSGGSSNLTELFRTEPSGKLADFRPTAAVAEAQTSFDSFAGGKRNHDLLVTASAAGGRVIVGIEGKADESFGETIRQFRERATRRQQSGNRTNALARLENLLATIGGSDSAPEQLGRLRYQLFSATAGTLAAARDAHSDAAVLVIHEFVTDRTDREKQAANMRDLNDYLVEILRLPAQGSGTWVVGATHVAGSDMVPASVQLWVAHLRTVEA